MASPQAEQFHEMVKMYRDAALGNGAATPSLEEMRAGAEQLMQVIGVVPDGVSVVDSSLAGRAALHVDAAGGRTDHIVLHFHGGAYVMNSIQSHTKVSAGIAKASGCRVISFDYRMAPEHPFPSAIDDGLSAYQALLDAGTAASQIVITGDSAGGGLTVATLLAAKAAGLPQPAGAVLYSPWTDLEGTGASMDSHKSVDLLVDRDAMQMMAAIYLNGVDAQHPHASVIYADHTGLAPLYIQVGGHETLLDDSTRLAVNAAHAGVDVRLDVFPEMQHVFQTALGMIPEADDAIARTGAWIRTRFQLA
jgi:epsilon-lactone hydrolase